MKHSAADSKNAQDRDRFIFLFNTFAFLLLSFSDTYQKKRYVAFHLIYAPQKNIIVFHFEFWSDNAPSFYTLSYVTVVFL